MRVRKVINNNILCLVDDRGSEMIVTGKGLGFKRKIGERVDPALVEKTCHIKSLYDVDISPELVSKMVPIERTAL